MECQDSMDSLSPHLVGRLELLGTHASRRLSRVEL
jgi:hypothetical protein